MKVKEIKSALPIKGIAVGTVQIQSLCPYCGTRNIDQEDTLRNNGHIVALCDNDSGGCDNYYVVNYRLIMETRSLEVEDPDRKAGVDYVGVKEADHE